METPHEHPDSKQPERSLYRALLDRGRAVLGTPLGVMSGYLVFILIMTALLGVNAESDRNTNALYWMLPPMILVGLFIPYTITSIAHLIMARSLGFRVDYFAIGPVQIVDDNRTRLRIHNRWDRLSSYRIKSLGIGNGWKQNVAIYVSAGWMATAIPIWTFTPIWNRLMERTYSGAFDLQTASTWGIITAISIFILTLGAWGWALLYTIGGMIVPFRELFLDRDRVNHLMTHLDPPNKKRDQSTANSSGVVNRTILVNRQAPEQGSARPRDWEMQEILSLADDWTIQAPNIMMLLRAYYHFLDQGEPALAGSYLVRAVTAMRQTKAIGHPRIFPEAAFFFARHRGDLQSAAMYLRLGDHPSAMQHVYLRAGAAISLSESDFAQAAMQAGKALEILDTHSPPGMAIAEREWLEEIRNQATDSSNMHVA